MDARLWAMVLAFAVCVPASAQTDRAPAGKSGRVSVPKRGPKIGDPAPLLSPKAWFGGDAITEFRRGHVYVVMFWWGRFGPGYLQEVVNPLQEAYRGREITFVGVGAVEDYRGTDKGVLKAAQKFGPSMGFRIAADTENVTAGAYGVRKGVGDSVFIVDGTGSIAFRGDYRWMEKALAGILNGGRDANAGGNQLKNDEQHLKRAEFPDREYPQVALKEFRAYETNYPITSRTHGDLLLTAAVCARDTDAACEAGEREFEKAVRDWDAQRLNRLAWSIVSPGQEGEWDPMDARLLDLALRMAEKACELSCENDSYKLDTLARVHYLRNNLNKAIEIQTRAAYGCCPQKEFRERLTAYLDEVSRRPD